MTDAGKHGRRGKKRLGGLLAGLMVATMTVSLASAPMGALAAEGAPPGGETVISESAVDEVSAAERALSERRQEQSEADVALIRLQEEYGGVTETSVSEADAAKTAAEAKRDEAQAAYDTALSAQADAEEAVCQAEARAEDADAALTRTREERAQTESDISAQTEAVAQAEADAAEAERAADDDPAYLAAVNERDLARDALEAVVADREADDAAVRSAQAALEEAQDAEDAAREELLTKQAAAEDAQAALDAANAAKEAASAAKTEAETALSVSESAYRTAREHTAAKEAEHTAALRTVEEADAAIAEADEAIARAETALADAQAALDDIQTAYDQGSLGFIRWMLEKDDLTDAQRADLEKAEKVLEDAMEETFASILSTYTGMPEEREDKVVVLGDAKDATSLDNIAVTFDVMRRINELRAQDDNYVGDMQRNEALTSFYFMTCAQSAAMRGAGLLDHSYFLPEMNCENLAWGYADPTLGWYDQEKAYFDFFKEDLGITDITSSDVRTISREAGRYGYIVGHYTNLMYTPDQVMGVGYTGYRNTFSFVGTRSSRYDASVLYTVDELEALFSAYCDSLSVSRLQQAVTEAETALNDANATKQEKLTAVQTAQAAAEAVRQELEQARGAETTAQEAVAAGAVAVQQKAGSVEEAQALVETMQTVLEEAEAAVTAAENGVTAARNGTAAAGSAVEAAIAARALDDAGIAEAEAVVAEKQSVVERFSEALENVWQTVREARAGLERLWERLTGRQDAVAAAEAEKLAAEAALADARAEAAARQEILRACRTELSDAQAAAEHAAAESADAHQKLEDLRAASRRAEEAAAAVTEAEAALEAAQKALEAAEDKTEEPAPSDENDERVDEHDAEEPELYQVNEGASSVWQPGGSGTLDFTVNRGEDDAYTFSHFIGVEIDGVLVDPAYYTAAAGSLHVSLHTAYLETLPAGSHSIRFVFDDGAIGSVFRIGGTEEAAPMDDGVRVSASSTGVSAGRSAGTAGRPVVSPKTGDDAPIALFITLGMASLLGLVILTRFRKADRQ